MHLLLAILKVIGIILLIVLFVILALVFAVLFCPVRYQILAENNENTRVHFKGSFLLFVLRFLGAYEENEVTFRVKLFGFVVFQYPNKKPKISNDFKKKDGKKNRKKAGKKSGNKSSLPTEDAANERNDVPKDSVIDTKGIPENPKNSKVVSEEKEEAEIPQKAKERKHIFTGLKQVFTKIKEWILHFPEKLTRIREKIKSGKDEIFNEGNKELIGHLLKELRYVIKHLRPKKVKADVTFSTGDPARTGQILGILCMFPVMYSYDMHIVPDFVEEHFYVKGTLELKGQVRLIYFMIVAIRLLKDKNFRRLFTN